MTRRLIVVPDIAEAAAELFVALKPRTLALAGGSTPQRLYERLATCDIAWFDTDVFFGDERCVPPDHPASNFAMASESLLSKVPARVHRMRGEDCDAAGYERELTEVFGSGVPKFDLVLLGLGEDGHTASLFPRDAALGVTDRRVIRVERPDYPRLTLTLPVLSAASVALFLVSGKAKRVVTGRLLRGENIPAARVAAREVVIIADEEAAPVGGAG